jgi:hypothetical protein
MTGYLLRLGLPGLFRRTQAFNQGADVFNSPSRNPGAKPHGRREASGADTHPPSAFFYWDERWNRRICFGIAEDMRDTKKPRFGKCVHLRPSLSD